jgi:hypothetical protein
VVTHRLHCGRSRTETPILAFLCGNGEIIALYGHQQVLILVRTKSKWKYLTARIASRYLVTATRTNCVVFRKPQPLLCLTKCAKQAAITYADPNAAPSLRAKMISRCIRRPRVYAGISTPRDVHFERIFPSSWSREASAAVSALEKRTCVPPRMGKTNSRDIKIPSTLPRSRYVPGWEQIAKMIFDPDPPPMAGFSL